MILFIVVFSPYWMWTTWHKGLEDF